MLGHRGVSGGEVAGTYAVREKAQGMAGEKTRNESVRPFSKGEQRKGPVNSRETIFGAKSGKTNIQPTPPQFESKHQNSAPEHTQGYSQPARQLLSGHALAAPFPREK